MMNKYIRNGMLGLLIVVLHCNAPHQNPLDPENPDFAYGEITGTVETISAPVMPLADVSVLWANDQVFTHTTADGHFSIANVVPANGDLIFTKEGYKPDTVKVEWSDDRRVVKEVRLNALPGIDSLVVYTTVDYRSPDFPAKRLSIYIRINDVERDVDSVYVQNEQYGFKHYLTRTTSYQVYEGTFSAAQLNLNSLHQIVGRPLDLYAVDVYNNHYKMGSGAAVRIITEEIEPLEPYDNQPVSALPDLRWNHYNPGFDYYFIIEVYQYSSFERVIYEPFVSSDSTHYKINSILQSGSHVWRLWCVDSFNNRISSKYLSFTVVNF